MAGVVHFGIDSLPFATAGIAVPFDEMVLFDFSICSFFGFSVVVLVEVDADVVNALAVVVVVVVVEVVEDVPVFVDGILSCGLPIKKLRNNLNSQVLF